MYMFSALVKAHNIELDREMSCPQYRREMTDGTVFLFTKPGDCGLPDAVDTRVNVTHYDPNADQIIWNKSMDVLGADTVLSFYETPKMED